MSTEERAKQEYRVHLTGYQSASITVEVEDSDIAIDEALNEGIPDICGQCGGWGQGWSRDGGDEWTPESVTDAAGNEVWVGPTPAVEAIIRELGYIHSDITASPNDALKIIDCRLRVLREGLS